MRSVNRVVNPMSPDARQRHRFFAFPSFPQLDADMKMGTSAENRKPSHTKCFGSYSRSAKARSQAGQREGSVAAGTGGETDALGSGSAAGPLAKGTALPHRGQWTSSSAKSGILRAPEQGWGGLFGP